MTEEQKAYRLQLIKESHQRVQDKRAKELAEDEEIEITDLFDEIEKTFKGDKKNGNDR